MSFPSKKISPSVGSISLRIARAVVDFPHPLSPTSPRLSPSLQEETHTIDRIDMADGLGKDPSLDGKVLLQVFDFE